ncbi:MAG: SCO family protein [Balneolaceae bacterium]
MRFNNLLLPLIILSLIVAASCTGEEQPDTHNVQEHAQSDHSSMEAGQPSDHSIYHAGSTWLNRNNEEIGLESLRGKIQVVAMVYTHCDFACPRIIADMKRIESSLSPEELANTNFVIVSIDPERDTPERLSTFAEENNLDPQNWTLLNGDSGDILELAALLGVKYRRISDNDFSHSNIITVLNRDGEVAYTQQQIGNQPTNTIRTIKELAG